MYLTMLEPSFTQPKMNKCWLSTIKLLVKLFKSIVSFSMHASILYCFAFLADLKESTEQKLDITVTTIETIVKIRFTLSMFIIILYQI